MALSKEALKILKDAQKYQAGLMAAVSYTKDALVGLGIIDADPCKPDSVLKGVQDAVTKWSDDLKKTIDGLSFKIGGNFLVTIGIMLAQFLGAAYITVVNNFLLAALGNAAGAIVSALMGALAVLAGADLVFQYYQIRYLKEQLERRLLLINYVKDDMNFVLNYLISILKLGVKNLAASNTDRVFPIVLTSLNEAIGVLRAERSRVTGNAEDAENAPQVRPISEASINRAKKSLDKAIDAFTGPINPTKIESALKRIEQRYGLRINAAAPSTVINLDKTAHLIAWFDYIKEMGSAINKAFFKYDNPVGSNAYKQEVAKKQRLYTNLIMDLIPELPEYLRAIVMQQMLGPSIDRIMQKIPVFVSAFGKLAEGLERSLEAGGSNLDIKSFTDPTTMINNGISSLGLGISKPTEPAFFVNEATKDLTVQTLTTGVKYVEALILMFPESWRNLLFLGSIQLNILNYVITNLTGYQIDIRQAYDDKLAGNLTDTDLMGKKLDWAVKLGFNSQALNSLVSQSKVSVGRQSMSGNNMQEVVMQASAILEDLKEMIVEKSVDFGSGVPESKKEPVELAYTIAQQNLAPLAANVLILLSSSMTARIVAALDAIKLLYSNQITLDSLELSFCNEYIKVLENSPEFMALKAKIDEMLAAFSKTFVGSLAEDLLNGDLSKVLDMAQGAQDLADMAKALDCASSTAEKSDKPPFYMDGIITALSGNPLNGSPSAQKIRMIVQDVKKSINTLSEQKDMMLDELDNIKESMDKVKEIKPIEVDNGIKVESTSDSEIAKMMDLLNSMESEI